VIAQRTDFIMNTPVEQTVIGPRADTIAAQAATLLHQLERALTFFQPTSDIWKLNHSEGNAVKIQKETATILRAALHYSKLSASAFDITAAPLTDLWRQHGKQQQIPTEDEIKHCLSLVGAHYLTVTDSTAALDQQGCAVDLGGIAKGLAADACIDFYRTQGVHSAYVNLGGNVKALGGKSPTEPWSVGLQHPTQPRGTSFAALSITDESVVTSGSYERFTTVDGHRYHHIIDPRTGWPADSGLLSVTVVCENSMQADALSTAAFVLGLADAQHLLQSQPTQAVFVTDNGDVYITEGLRSRFQLAPDYNHDCYLLH